MEEHRRRAGERLVLLREAKRWNQEELAHAAGLSVKTVSRFENGRHDGRRATIRALAKALGVQETDLIGEPPLPIGLGESHNPPAIGRLWRVSARNDRPPPDRRETVWRLAVHYARDIV